MLLAQWFCLVLGLATSASCFSIRSTFVGGSTRDLGFPTTTRSTRRSNHDGGFSCWSMRDHSASSGFQIGETVMVVAENVIKAGCNLKGRQGRVLETWEKCEVDPTCCCAEQVNPDMAVRVEFSGTEQDSEATTDGASFTFYFAEDELRVIENETTQKMTLTSSSSVPFDGLSCKTFKLDQLRVDEKPRKLAFYDPNQK